MPPPRSIEHITITSGAVRTARRSEMSDRAVDAARAAIAAGEPLADSPWRCLILQTPEGGRAFDLTYRGRPMVRCWLCLDDSVAEPMWEAATSGVIDPGVRLVRPRRAPWLAAALLPAAIEIAPVDPTVLMEAAEIEIIVAWALLE